MGGGGIQKTQVRIKQLCNWLSAPGSPTAAAVIWLWRRRSSFPKANSNSGKAQHGSQTWTSKRCSDRLADISLSDPPGGGLRCGGRFSPAPGHHPDRGGLLRLPRLVRTEAERAAVRESCLVRALCPVMLTSTALIPLCVISCGHSGTRFVPKRLIRNVPYWNQCVKRNGNHVGKVEGNIQEVQKQELLFVALLRLKTKHCCLLYEKTAAEIFS